MVWFCNLLAAFACLCVGVTVSTQVDIFDDDMTAFNKLVDELNLTFTSASELIKRLNAFNKAKQEIQEYATKYPGATFEINKFSLMTDQELKRVSN